jgi:hypothetical protein
MSSSRAKGLNPRSKFSFPHNSMCVSDPLNGQYLLPVILSSIRWGHYKPVNKSQGSLSNKPVIQNFCCRNSVFVVWKPNKNGTEEQFRNKQYIGRISYYSLPKCCDLIKLNISLMYALFVERFCIFYLHINRCSCTSVIFSTDKSNSPSPSQL